jgi:hypothetical protein
MGKLPVPILPGRFRNVRGNVSRLTARRFFCLFGGEGLLSVHTVKFLYLISVS